MKHRLLVLTALTLLSPVLTQAQLPKYARVISENANLRETPSLTSSSEQEVAEGTVVKVLDQKLPWYVVRVRDRVGWMHGNTIEFVSSVMGITATTPLRSDNPSVRPPTISPVQTTNTGKGYILGPRGGCYYLSGSGRKVYVDRSLCN